MWPFKQKPAPPSDKRDWNEDWQIGDTAECIVDGVNASWHHAVKPWEAPKYLQRLTVSGFREGEAKDNTLRYFLQFGDWPISLPTTGFRKVRPQAKEESEIVERILKAKPGKDRVREPAATAQWDRSREADETGTGSVHESPVLAQQECAQTTDNQAFHKERAKR